VSCSITLAVWNVRPTPARTTWCSFFPMSSTPPKRAEPVERTSPVIASTIVVFPAPFGPMRKRRSPWTTVRSTPSTATNPSNVTRRSRTSR